MNSSGAALLALRAIRRSSLTSNNTTWTVSSRSFAAQPKDTSKSSGGGGATSGGAGAGVNLQGKNLDPPGNVYKQVDKSALGPGASKESDYKNPEYFSYHNMSYTEMELVMAKYRVPQPSNRK